MIKSQVKNCVRGYSKMSQVQVPHLVNIGQLTNEELSALVSRASGFKAQIRSQQPAPYKQYQRLLGKVITMLFSKRSTRTRVSTEAAASYFGANPMFLGKDDIQLGVNETIHDTVKIISSMTACIFARVNKHEEIQELCKHSSVPIINSLCDKYHPLQAITDIMTIKENFPQEQNLKLAWIGDANNVINDLAIAAIKSNISVSISVPETVEFDQDIKQLAEELAQENGVNFEIVHDPFKALNNANVVVTDTWISMGQESEKVEKLKQFHNYQITQDMVTKAKVNPNWKFMHCLPRHPEEVADDVFYSENSVVFEEGENRLYAALAVIEGFVINKGDLMKGDVE